jgi:hypothetical protein
MKKILFLILSFAYLVKAEAQTAPVSVEKSLTDTICSCMTATDFSKVNNKKDAMDVITDCFGRKTDLLMKLADEKHIDPTDQAAMKQLGIQIGKDLLNENCSAFLKISEKLSINKSEEENGNEGTTSGAFKRIELKGFNYIVLTDNNNGEKSFIWLRQFPGSEKFMNGAANLAGKKISVKWHELEVYLPSAKGYYKIKEITSIDIL